MDLIMTNSSIHLGILRLFAVACIIIASKFEEDANNVKFSLINEKLLDNSFCLEDFCIVEKHILKMLDFNLMIPTLATYIDYFSKTTIILEDYHTYLYNCGGVDFRYGSYENMLRAMNISLYEMTDANLISEYFNS